MWFCWVVLVIWCMVKIDWYTTSWFYICISNNQYWMYYTTLLLTSVVVLSGFYSDCHNMWHPLLDMLMHCDMNYIHVADLGPLSAEELGVLGKHNLALFVMLHMVRDSPGVTCREILLLRGNTVLTITMEKIFLPGRCYWAIFLVANLYPLWQPERGWRAKLDEWRKGEF